MWAKLPTMRKKGKEKPSVRHLATNDYLNPVNLIIHVMSNNKFMFVIGVNNNY